MTEDETVRASFPQAEIQYQSPAPGADLHYDRDGFFAVYAGPGLGTELLGRGRPNCRRGRPRPP
jgi:hypothetical protein